MLAALRIFFCLFLTLNAIPASTAHANPLYASLTMDAQTGKILSERYADKKLHPASLTKVMTLIMAFDALKQGKLRMSDKVYISNHAASMIPSKLGLEPGSSIQVRDAILALSVKSANDIAVAMAEHLGGSERNFARMMTFRAKSLGMKNTRFMNASGLHDKKQVSTARDMAIMARYVISHYPDYYTFFSKASFTYQGKTYRNHNTLMRSYQGMDGFKTGYIGASGFNLIASAVRNDRRIIGVVFGGKTAQSRNLHMARLLDDGFRKLPVIREARAPLKAPAPQNKPDMMQLASYQMNTKQEPAAGSPDTIPPPQTKYHATVNLMEQGSGTAIAPERSWSIQVGAFKSEPQTMSALRKAIKQLPSYYKRAEPQVVPLILADTNLYRARLSGYSAHDAYAACAYIKECIAIAP